MTTSETKTAWLFPAGYGLLAFALGSLLLPFADYVTSDGVAYLRLAENLFAGKGVSVNAGEPYVRHSPFYSFLAGGANLFWRNLEFSGHFISILSFSLTVIPLFFLTKEIYSERAARWAGFLFATNGFLLSHSYLIMTESLFTLFLFTQLWGFHRLIQGGRLRGSSAFLLGLVGGLGYLTRPEGLLFYGAGLGSFLFLGTHPFGAKIRFCLLLGALFLAFVLPYARFVSRVMGHLEFGGQGREVLIKRQLDFAHPGRYGEVKKIYGRLGDDKKKLKMEELVERFSLPYYLKADRFALIRGGLSSIVPRLLEFNNYFFAGLGFLFTGASCLGIPWDAKRKRSEFLLTAFSLCFLPYLFLLFYPRRYFPLLAIFLMGMGNGVDLFTRWMRETFKRSENKLSWVSPGLCLLLALPSAWYLGHVHRHGDFPSEDKALGLWMKKNIPAIGQEGVASQAQFVNFYSGSKIVTLPSVEKFEDFLNYMAYKKAKYFVVSDDFEESLKESYGFLLDETKSPPPGISRRKVWRGEKKKMILYEIEARSA